MKRLSRTSKLLLEKARDSATQAISTYNDPRSSFRTGNFTVLMNIAWTALIHCYFEQKKVNYYYKKENGRYEKVDGEKKAWDLGKSIENVFEENNPVRKNLELFIKLRDKIEHRNLPAIDPEIMGECQSLVLNFESWVIEEFGRNFSLIDTIFIPIQLTSARRTLPKTNIENNVIEFIKNYRNVLGIDILNSQQFTFKAYLVPKIGNHRSSSDIAIEFIKYDESNPEEMAKYDKAIIAIKERQIPISNLNLYKPSQVLEQLFTRGVRASMHWHTNMWHKYKVRPLSGSNDFEKTKKEFCVYDKPHRDYLYTESWIKLLAKQLKTPKNKIIKK